MAENTAILDKIGENAGEMVSRASRQKPNSDNFFMSTYNWVKKAEMDEPEWGNLRGGFVDNRIRDEWLMMMSHAEPHLSSVLSTAITLDANRQYKLVGGRNQVIRFIDKFKEFNNGLGFRNLQEANAQNYYVSDVGSIVEIETDGKNGPLNSLYQVDPTRVRLGQERLLKYDTNDIWTPDQYYRLASLKSTQDKMNKLGFSAVSRCLKLAQIMIAVVEHNLEKLGHMAPKGILFIQAEDLTQEAWEEAMEARKAVYITNTGNRYYDDVMTIVDRAAKGELLALSELPENFDTFEFTDYMLKGYALAFGRDVRAFWSLNSGNFGGGTEAKIQDEKATYAGGAEFILASQEQIQVLMPDSLLFEYEVEDTKGKFAKAELDKLLIESATMLLDIGITTQQAQSWLASHGVIPAEWTEASEMEVAENGVIKQLRNRYIEMESVQRTLNENPDEAVVMYESPSVSHPTGRIVRLWDNREEAIGKSWVVKKNLRATIADLDFMNQDNRGNEMYVAAAESYLSSANEDDLTPEQLEALALASFLLQNPEEIDEENMSLLDGLLVVAIGIGIVDLLRSLRDFSDDAVEFAELLRPDLWDRRLRYFANLGRLWIGDPDEELTWQFGNTIEHCSDCAKYNGQTKTRAEWQEIGLVPQSPELECQGYQCDCTLD